jgi:hypothetical protein
MRLCTMERQASALVGATEDMTPPWGPHPLDRFTLNTPLVSPCLEASWQFLNLKLKTN